MRKRTPKIPFVELETPAIQKDMAATRSLSTCFPTGPVRGLYLAYGLAYGTNEEGQILHTPTELFKVCAIMSEKLSNLVINFHA